MDNTEIKIIKDKYLKIKNISQLADILNKIEALQNLNTPQQKKITARDLNFLSISKNLRYKEYFIPKKNGEKRKIDAPDYYLKRIQYLLSRLLQIIFNEVANYNSNGFIDGRNILRNAKPHTNKNFVLNIDIKDFFPSIEFRRIKTVLELKPFNLANEKERISFIIANIVTLRNYLPQGAPTSPIVSNIVTQRLDRKITKLCVKERIRYSRYADDLTFSSNNNVFDEKFIQIITKIIEEENFKVNQSKTRVRTSMDRQEVTGLVVNQKVNIKREYLQSTRAMLNNWEKGGVDYAQSIFNIHKKKIGQKIDFRNALRGHIDFIGSIKGKDSPTYIRIKSKFEYLYNRLDYELITHEAVRDKLVKDNRKMELILLDNIHSNDDKFISFCTSAFHQIENLLNYYYWKKFPNIDDLKEFMWANNPAFQKRWKSLANLPIEERLKGLNKYSRVRDFDINTLVYLFEKEFYFDKKQYYNNEITFLREIRNDDSHRCSILDLDRDRNKIMLQYEAIKEKWVSFQKKMGKFPQKQKEELDIEFKVNLFKFMDEKNYNQVRKILKNIVEKSTKTKAI